MEAAHKLQFLCSVLYTSNLEAEWVEEVKLAGSAKWLPGCKQRRATGYVIKRASENNRKGGCRFRNIETGKVTQESSNCRVLVHLIQEVPCYNPRLLFWGALSGLYQYISYNSRNLQRSAKRIWSQICVTRIMNDLPIYLGMWFLPLTSQFKTAGSS